ncbi:caspase family protein [Streptomyces phaeolivaceus]|uniref:caspase family protein n=1 Tax=Streptomyces phaeolivaceus TaxID=2653200 RepID=UPI001869DE31|nr:caspase family protein [Streptomyces phaeolivaceus]
MLRALLIAVPVPGLEFVREDVKHIKESLLRSGYAEADVTVLNTLDATRRGEIYAALRRFFAKCRDGDFALVHFSGHGVRIGDREFLVPGHVNADAGREGLVEVVPDVFFEQLDSQATVLMCLDSCRDEVSGDGEFKPPAAVPASSRSRENVFIMHACAPGQAALGTAAGSFMSRALAEALAPESTPRTVRDVITYVRRRTGEIAQDHGGNRRHQPYDRWLGRDDTAKTPAEHDERVICKSGPGTQKWARVVHDSALWDRIADPGVDKGRLKDSLGLLINKVVAIRRDAELPNRAGPDPWDDAEFPERVVARLDSLIPATPEGRLSALEVVALLATPFFREAAVACGRRALAELYLREAPGKEDKTGRQTRSSDRGDDVRPLLREDMVDVRRAYKNIEAKRQRLLEAGSHSAAEAVESWLRHRLLADWDQLWTAVAGPGPVVGALDSLRGVMEQLLEAAESAAALGPRPPVRSRDHLRSALLQVISQMRTPPAVSAPNGEEWQGGLDTFLGLRRRKWWRPRELAGLVHIAELLAIDPRALDGIVVDHLGELHLGVNPKELIAQVRGSEFHPVNYAVGHETPPPSGTPAPDQRVDWSLHSECGSAALHVALERQAHAAAAAARNLFKSMPNEALFDALPRHVNTDALLTDGNRNYEAPPPRFQLSEDGVKPLIMGTQLYGDRMLAVRELYQNALDACRRRWARQRYAQQTGLSDFGGSGVKPLAEHTIEFTVGRDDDQRLYIECVDHGIGMTEEELRDLFARAGRRYEQSPTRVRELRRWRRAGIDPELNSRFGIGVFSYFMLAEQITVVTRPANESGRTADGRAHRVDVVADSGLMHITKAELGDAGTVVRLYLRPEASARLRSLIKFLRKQVWHCPTTLVVNECLDNPRDDRWEPNELKPDVTLAVPQATTPDGIWWVHDQGARLVDGIFVDENDSPHGYVINLRRRHAPDLSANRNKLQHFDKDLAYQELSAAVDALTQWDPMPLKWLWELVHNDHRLGEIVLERLLATDIKVSVDEWHSSGTPAIHDSLARLGCLPYDRSAGRYSGASGSGFQFFQTWRAQLLSDGLRHRRDARWVIGQPEGFPGPTALDALLFREEGHLERPLTAVLHMSRGGGHDLRTALRTLRRYAVTGMAVPEVNDLRKLDGMEADPLHPDLYGAYALSRGGPFRSDGLDAPLHLPILRTAGQSGRPLGEIAELVHGLRVLDPGIPEPPELGELARHIPDRDETRVLLGGSGLGGLPALVTPAVAAYVAANAGLQVSDVLNTARTFAPFGFRITGKAGTKDELGTVNAIQPELNESFLWPRRLNGPLTLLGLARLSARRDDPDVGTTAEYLRGITGSLGLGDVSPGPLEGVKASAWWTSLPMVAERNHQPLSTWTTLRTMANASASESPESMVRSVEALAAAGVVDGAAVDAVRRWVDIPRGNRPHLLTDDERNLRFRDQSWSFGIEYDPTSNRVDHLFLVALAAERHGTLGDTAEAVRAEAEPYRIDVAEVPPEAQHLEPTLIEVEALSSVETSHWKTEITFADIVPYAHAHGISVPEAMARLREYEPLGAPPVPRAAPRPDGQWEEPDERAALAVESLLSYEPLNRGIVTPLALTVTAVRMGLGLRSTFQALVPYTACGVVVECPVPADDDHAPDWRDVIVLTRRLSGSEPALAGEVPDEHILLASEETDLSCGEVRDRLAYYAPLFAFRLPPENSGVPEERSTHAARP